MAALNIVHRLNRRNMRRDRVFRDRRNPLDLYNDSEFVERFRLPRWKVLELAEELNHELEYRLPRKGALNPAMQLMVALRFYACGAFQQVIGDTFGISKMTVHKTVQRVSAVLFTQLERHVFLPCQEAANANKRKFFSKYGFPGCFGCVDCTHVKIQAPTENEGEFVNRKGYHSINVQLICDADMVIINAVVRWPGSVHDSRILRQSIVFDNLDQDPPILQGHLLGDSGYMLR